MSRLGHTESPGPLFAGLIFQEEPTGTMEYNVALDCRNPLELSAWSSNLSSGRLEGNQWQAYLAYSLTQYRKDSQPWGHLDNIVGGGPPRFAGRSAT